jgi:hypothetical protein
MTPEDDRYDEAGDGPSCRDCGEPTGERAYGFGDSEALCWSCALRRGGSYDADQGRWAVAPDTSDLPPWQPRS